MGCVFRSGWRLSSLLLLLPVLMGAADPQEVERVTGYVPGAVSPLGLARPLRVLCDRRLCSRQEVSIGAGIRNAGVVLRTEDLIRLVGPEVGDFLEIANP